MEASGVASLGRESRQISALSRVNAQKKNSGAIAVTFRLDGTSLMFKKSSTIKKVFFWNGSCKSSGILNSRIHLSVGDSRVAISCCAASDRRLTTEKLRFTSFQAIKLCDWINRVAFILPSFLYYVTQIDDEHCLSTGFAFFSQTKQAVWEWIRAIPKKTVVSTLSCFPFADYQPALRPDLH